MKVGVGANRGLSLMEIMVALGVVAFALITMIGVFISSIRLMNRGEEMTRATELARTTLESARIAGYASIPESATTLDGRRNDPQLGGFPPDPYPGDENYKIVMICDKIDDDLKSVAVKVFYDEKSHVVLQTFLKP